MTLDARSSLPPGTGATLWSGAFGRPRGESAALLADTARALAGAVNAPLTGAEATRLGQVRSTSPAAEEAYLQGRTAPVELRRLNPPGARSRRSRRAVNIDANYGAAHAGAALAYVRLGDAGVLSLSDARHSAVADIRKAFAAGEDGAEVRAALAETKFLYDWDWAGAEREYRRSLDSNPGFVQPRAEYAQVLATQRRFDEALAISEETMRIDPQSSDALINHGHAALLQEGFRRAPGRWPRPPSRRSHGKPPDYLLASRVAEAQGRYGGRSER